MAVHGRKRTDVTDDGHAKEGVSERTYSEPSDADRVRELITQLGLSQRAIAKELDINDRVMRYYCSGEQPVPRVVMLALEHLVCLQRQVMK
jgi:ribosome-binding protein aMBF1 (putative translation factor)